MDDEYVVYVELPGEDLEMLVSASNWQATCQQHGTQWQLVKAPERKDWEIVKRPSRAAQVGPKTPRLDRLLAKAGLKQEVRHINGDPLDLRNGNLELVDVRPARTRTPG